MRKRFAKIKLHAIRIMLSVSMALLIIASGQIFKANSILALQNNAPNKTYAKVNSHNLLANRFLGIDISDEYVFRNLRSGNEPNYAEDEAKIKDFSENERYRSTQLEQGAGTFTSFSDKENMNEFIDGFRYRNLEPSATSSDVTLWGIEIELNKEKSQRTYTDFYFTNTGNLGSFVNTGNIPANYVGDNLSAKDGFEDTTYKASSEIEITGSRAQRNFNLYSNEEDLKYINSIENKNTVMAWQSNYLKDNPNGPLWATQGPSSAYGFAVNPWPNENDELSLIKLNGSHDKKEFVQGQTITTDITIENLDDNAKKRLVGQVYHPITGEIVPGTNAYINDQNKVVIEMPKGAVDENGNINKDSIFYSDPTYKALQNLEVKFFARPRTAEEFTKIANDNEGTYTPTGAGTATINHKGENVEIDLQGIDRYDHYNLIGSFKINLDDTRYYDQGFIDGNSDDTSKHTSSKVRPGEKFEVRLYVPEDKKDKDVFPNQKTAEEMEAAKDKNEAVGTIDMSFIDRENKGKAPEDQWKITYDKETLPTTFTVTPPKSAKAGEFIAVPLTYTYTNGSTDTHWFHFVVQESTNNRPEYYVQVEYPSEEQKSMPKVPEDEKKLNPVSYSIPEGTEFKDDKGNVWKVSIDEKTGEVTAKPHDPSQFDGGEKLQVPVVAHYKDPSDPDKDITEETTAEFVIKEKYNLDVRYNAKVGKAGDALSSDLIVDQNDKFNRKPTKFTLDSDTFVDNKGNTWNVTIDENTGKVTATVPNAEEGKTIDGALLNVPVTAHYSESDGTEIGTKKVEVQFVAYGTEGTKTYTEKIPFEYHIEYDPNFYTKYPDAKDNYKIVVKGKAGEKTTTWTIKDSKIVGEPEITETKPVDAVIKVGQQKYSGTFKTTETKTVEFNTKYIVDNTLEPGKVVVDNEGSLGEEEITTTHTIENGEIVKSEKGKPVRTKDPVDRIVRVGTKPTEGIITETIEREIPYETKIIYDDTKDAGFQEIEKEGKPGKEEVTITQEVKDSKPVGKPKETTKTITEKEDRVIKIGVKPVVKVEQIPEGKTYKHNPELKAGEIVKKSDGTPGKIIITTTFNKETGKNETSIERIEPTDAVYEYGSKTEGKVTVKSDIPFEVEIVEDPEMEAGKTETVQEGKLGKKETTITIKNSKEVSREENITEEPVKKIVKVGTKSVCEIPPIPGGEDPKDPENPENPGGEDPKDPENPENPGDEEPGTSGTDNPGHPGTENPSVDNPKTGDEMNVSLYVSIIGLMGSAILALKVKKNRKH